MRNAPFMKVSLAVAVVLGMLCTGCSTAWVSTLDSILAAAAPALINILQIVAVAEGLPVNATWKRRSTRTRPSSKDWRVTLLRLPQEVRRAFARNSKGR